MDHEVVPRLLKICDSMLNSSRDDFSLLSRKKNVRMTMQIRGPQNTYFKAYIIH
jgi:hypothetical protein